VEHKLTRKLSTSLTGRCVAWLLACIASGWLLYPVEAQAQAPAASSATDSATEPGGELMELIFNLINEEDKDLRALGFDQVRGEAKGEAATLQFASVLPKLAVDAQVGLLSALADRGDRAARPAVLELLEKSTEESVRVAAISAIGHLGEAADVPLLIQRLTMESPMEQAAARASLVRLPGESIPSAIAEQLGNLANIAGVQVTLMEILAERRAVACVPELLRAAEHDDAKVRGAAMAALSQLASEDAIPGLVRGVLKAASGPERDAAEKALMAVCQRIESREKRAIPVLATFDSLSPAEQTALLPALGRIGGEAAIPIIERAITSQDAKMHEMGVRALCNWPDGSVAQRFLELIASDEHADHKRLARRALIRVAVVSDGRSDADRLMLLMDAMKMCEQDDERELVVQRARAVRSVDSLRYLLTYLDHPSLAQEACESIVELAHHRTLRDAYKNEFHAALDRVMQTTQDPIVKERAQRYKNNQTWARAK
jgi:HEAT repeat protein